MHLFPLLALATQVAQLALAQLPHQQRFGISNAPPSDPGILTSTVEAAINSILKDFQSPGGVSVAVVQKRDNGSRWSVETNGYGVARVDGTAVTSDTLFAIGSNSKLFDVLATGLLISNKTLSTPISWNTKLASIMPEWGLMDPVASSESTIIDLMSHRTGLPRHDMTLPLENMSDYIRSLRYLKPSLGFREQWQYNNHMYGVLSHLPQILAGIPFEEYVDEFILKPLNMDATTYYSTIAERSGHLADGIARDGVNATEDPFGQGTVRALPYWLPNDKPGNLLSGAGGLISNAKDMAIWLQTLLNEGQHPTRNKTVIPAEVMRRAAAGVTVAGPVADFPELSPVVYGGGLLRGTYRGFEYIEHGGYTAGFRSQITRIPSQNFGVAVLSNDDSFGTEIVEAIKFLIMDEVLKLDTIDWSARFKARISAAVDGQIIPTPHPINATRPLLPFTELVGTYQDRGYGTLELCFVNGDNKASTPKCNRLLKEISVTLPGVIDPDTPTFISRWPAFRLSHISLAHFEHNLFNFSMFNSLPTGNASSPFWVKVRPDYPSLVAEFAYDDDGMLGIGLRGGIWGADEGVQSPEGQTVKERAEVWFKKLR